MGVIDVVDVFERLEESPAKKNDGPEEVDGI
jgi:hypothetical protein